MLKMQYNPIYRPLLLKPCSEFCKNGVTFERELVLKCIERMILDGAPSLYFQSGRTVTTCSLHKGELYVL